MFSKGNNSMTWSLPDRESSHVEVLSGQQGAPKDKYLGPVRTHPAPPHAANYKTVGNDLCEMK